MSFEWLTRKFEWNELTEEQKEEMRKAMRDKTLEKEGIKIEIKWPEKKNG